jgi:tetratricopeptide (TPR) repeat protein
LAGLLDDPWRQQQELELQVALGSALTATQGWSGPDVGETISRARALAEQLDRPEHLVPLLVGQFAFHYVRAEYRPALALGEQLETIGATRNDPAAQMLSGFARGVTRFFLGQFDVARTVLETSIANAEPAHSNIASLSFDPCAATRAYLALTLACQGYIDQARFHMEQALLAARQLGHTHTLVYLLFHKTWLDWLTRSPLIHLEECSALTAEHGFPFFLRWISAYRGRSLITLGRAEEALALLTQTLSELRAGGCVTNTPTLLTWLAEAHAMLGHSAEERTCLAEAARIIGTTQERRFEAELLYRVPGDLLNAAGDRPAAEQHYRQAIASAERQGAKLFQLRASVSLARPWSDQGQRTEARNLLWPVYDWFTEGFDAPDLEDAKTLLDEVI